jgi:hypothetical protein
MKHRLKPAVRTSLLLAAVAVTLLWPPASHVAARAPQTAPAATLPSKLSTSDFWKLSSDISEPGGYFRIVDNYTSNENQIGRIFTLLRQQGKSGGVYIGVGPEQNLTYIAAIKPAMAFIIDIRRQAVMQHLMFKAMIEMSKDRADFISILFAKPRPSGLDAASPVGKIWEAFYQVATDTALAEKNKARVIERLTKIHGFSFTDDETWQLSTVLDAFIQFGPAITTRGGSGRGGGSSSDFAGLTGWSMDDAGVAQSFLSTEEHYQTVKTLHEKNLIVPVSGDFGGPKALRAIGAYVRERGSTVTAFYVSNVEQYLFQDRKDTAFYENVGTLPISDGSVFIRPYAMQRYGVPATLCGIGAFLKGVQAGRVMNYNESMACAQ